MAHMRTIHLLIPVKAFTRAKARLAPALDAGQRSTLAREMATRVVDAVRDLPTWIVCDDDAVAEWARSVGARVAWQPGLGLNGAVAAATTARFDAGADRVTVIHSDLPLISSIPGLHPDTETLVLVPDRHGTGTNVVSTPTPDFRFAYGAGSFRRHIDEAARLKIPTRVVHDGALGWDVDEPADLAVFDRSGP